MSQKHRTIILDIDDTMVNWREGFADWLRSRHGVSAPRENLHSYQFCYDLLELHGRFCFDVWVNEFNESEAFGNLTIKDHVDSVICELRTQGYKIVAISSCGDSQKTHDRRMENIGHLVDTLHCLPLLGDKEQALRFYKNEAFMFLDDSMEHIEKAKKVGIPCAFLYNEQGEGHINNWSELLHKLYRGIIDVTKNGNV